MNVDPIRLRDDPGIPEWCRRELFDEASRSVPEYDQARGLTSLREAIAEARSAPPARGRVRRWLARALAGLSVVVVGFAVVEVSHSIDGAPPSTSRAAPRVSMSAAADPAPFAPGIAVESLPTAPVESSPALSTALRPEPGARPRTGLSAALSAKSTESASPPSAVDPLEETRHLAALRILAESDPEAAVAAAAEGDRRALIY